jgi:archaemetzincin
MNQTTRRTFLGLGVAATAGIAAWQWTRPKEPPVPVFPEAPGRFPLEQAQAELLKIRPLHERKKPAEPGDWLAREGLVEYGQTFAEYTRGRPRVCEKYKSLYVLPLGKFSETEQPLIASVTEALGSCFGMPVTQLENFPLEKIPDWAERTNGDGRRQLWTQYVLDKVLPPRLPENAAALLGLTNIDLWPGEGWNYAFGMATLENRVGVWSTARFGNPEGNEQERRQFFRRLLKVALHETGHMYGITHCIAYECGMNGMNNLGEGDRQVLEFCPECQAKLWWTCDYPPQKRFVRMQEYFERNGFTAETDYYQRAPKALKL